MTDLLSRQQVPKMSLPGIIDLCSDDEGEQIGVNYAKSNLSLSKVGDKGSCRIASVKKNDIQLIKQEPVENNSPNAANSVPSGSTTDNNGNSLITLCPPASHESFVPLCRQFWKAGDYEVGRVCNPAYQDGKNRLRVHPKFLHSNATSHKWAFGAIAELLDNAVDEIQRGATFVIVDKIQDLRNGSPALLIRDNGSGMSPEALRHCMSFGFSNKQSDDSIGQYGNGFKTSTMRLGADVIVFSRCTHGRASTQSVGLLSYTFLRQTGSEDIVVPIVDYELLPSGKFGKLLHGGPMHFASNISTLLKWSPFATDDELLEQFDDIGHHGTKIIIYNLWLNDEGEMELDFESDASDIMLSGAQKIVEKGVVGNMISKRHIANQLRYSLRVYSSILYLHIPPHFQIFLRGQVVEAHHLVNDLKFIECIKYQPQGVSIRQTLAECIITVGFLDGAPNVNVQGFNVYHKNRLILPFWKVTNKSDSKGRGVAGVLEANFIKPTHDKQDFEKSPLYHRFEARLKDMTLEYWKYHCHLVGYPINRVLSSKPFQSVSSPHSVLLNSVAQSLNHGSSCQPNLQGQVVPSDHAQAQVTPGQFGATINSYFLGAYERQKAGDLEKRRRDSQISEIESSKKQALDGRTAVGVRNHNGIQARGGGLQQKQEIMIMVRKNKTLRAECIDYVKAVHELSLKVVKLRGEIEEVRRRHNELEAECRSIVGETKLEKH